MSAALRVLEEYLPAAETLSVAWLMNEHCTFINCFLCAKHHVKFLMHISYWLFPDPMITQNSQLWSRCGHIYFFFFFFGAASSNFSKTLTMVSCFLKGLTLRAQVSVENSLGPVLCVLSVSLSLWHWVGTSWQLSMKGDQDTSDLGMGKFLRKMCTALWKVSGLFICLLVW